MVECSLKNVGNYYSVKNHMITVKIDYLPQTVAAFLMAALALKISTTIFADKVLLI